MKRGAVAGVLALMPLAIAQQPPLPGTWSIEPAARDAGYRLEIVREGATPCAVMLPPAKPVSTTMSGSMVRTLNAAPYRGKTVRFSAWIRVHSVGFRDNGQLWMRVNPPLKPPHPITTLDSVSDIAINATDWSRSEVTLYVNPDADSVSLGVLSSGAGTIWAKDISLLVIAGKPKPETATEPANLKFPENQAGEEPLGWRVLSDRDTTPATYTTEVTAKGCHFGGACAVLESKPSVPPNSYGTLLQNFGAARYRGKTVRFRASLRLQHAGKEAYARLWVRQAPSGDSLDVTRLFEHLDYREVRTGDWTGVEIVRRIDDDVEEIGIGIMLHGRGRVTIDNLSFGVISDAALPSTVITVREPGLADAPPVAAMSPVPIESSQTGISIALPETNWPVLPRPSLEEQKVIINKASAHAVTYIRDLPNFLCNLLIDRSENRNEEGWQTRDVLTLQLGFSDRKERYRLNTVNGKPTNAAYRSVGGAISEGDFAGVMAQIFWPHTAQFTWDRWTNLRGHTAHVFRYAVDQKKSTYELQFGGVKGQTLSTLSAHHDYVFIEDETSYVLRIEQVADPPAGFPLRSAGTVIDYDWNEVGGHSYLLPLREEITMGSATLRSLNAVQFQDYRKFAAESAITFDQSDPPNN
jgi:hypothetical protein